MVDTLLALLLLHDADRVNPRPLSPVAEFIAIHIRQIIAAMCLAMAIIRTQDDSKRPWLCEVILEFLAFAVAMMERALSGCLGENMEQCSPLAAATMTMTILCTGLTWAACLYLQRKPRPDGSSLI